MLNNREGELEAQNLLGTMKHQQQRGERRSSIGQSCRDDKEEEYPLVAAEALDSDSTSPCSEGGSPQNKTERKQQCWPLYQTTRKFPALVVEEEADLSPRRILATSVRTFYKPRHSIMSLMIIPTLLLLVFLVTPVGSASSKQLVAVDEYECHPSGITELSRNFILTIVEDDLSWILDDEEEELVNDLLDAFRDTYNEQSFQSCDIPHFRTIQSITMDSIQDDTVVGSGSILAMTVSAECYNCTTSSEPLFPSHVLANFSSSLASTTNSSNSNGSFAAEDSIASTTSPVAADKQLSSSPSCVCPMGATPNSNRLSLKEFLPILNDAWRNVTAPWSVTLTVQTITELQIIPCSQEQLSFTSFAYVNVNVANNAVPSAKEVRALEDTFIRTYNQLSFLSCDPYFRTVVSATLDLEFEDRKPKGSSARWLQQQGSNGTFFTNMTATTTSPSSAPSLAPTDIRSEVGNAAFTVTGQCRNCPVTDTGSFNLFDDAFRRRARALLDDRGQILSPYRFGDSKRQKRDLAARMKGKQSLLEFDSMMQGNRWLQQNDICICPTETEEITEEAEEAPTLSQTDFLDSYNVELEELQEAGVVEAVEVAENVEEGQKVNCGTSLLSFKSAVFSDLRVNITSFTIEEARSLERSFQDSYNRLSYVTCDGHFRSVAKVELQVIPTASTPVIDLVGAARRLEDVLLERDLQQAIITNSSSGFNGTNSTMNSTGTVAPQRAQQEIVSTLFSVTGTCRDCPVTDTGTFNLFDDAFRRRRNLVARKNGHPISSSIYPELFRKLQQQQQQQVGTTDSCICPAGEEPQIGSGPTTENFEVAFNDEIEGLEDDGEAESVQTTAGNVVEGQPVLCDGELVQFKSFVYADIGVDPSTLPNSTIETLEKVFEETYNSVSFEACDEFFRVVSKVGLVVSNKISGRRLQSGNETDLGNSTDSSNSTRNEGRVLFEVTGRCRNCPVTDTGSFSLFDDAFRRSLMQKDEIPLLKARDPFLQFRVPSRGGRHLQQALDVCLCPIGKDPGEEQNTSRSAVFLTEYNTALVQAQEEQAQAADDAAGSDIPTAAPLPIIIIPVIEIEEVLEDPINATTPAPSVVSPPTTIPTVSPPLGPTPNVATVSVNVTAVPNTPLPTSPPTDQPTEEPTPAPTPEPTDEPTPSPTEEPTVVPTVAPTAVPTGQPSQLLLGQPTPIPSLQPTSMPTVVPSSSPSTSPSPMPTFAPTHIPTSQPSFDPTQTPTGLPSFSPTAMPTCTEPLQNMDATMIVTLTGDSSAKDNVYFADAFLNASQSVESTCSVEVLAVTVQSRTSQRRRLQGTAASEDLVFLASADLVSLAAFYSTDFVGPLSDAFNAILQNANIVALIQGSSLSPSSSPSLTPSNNPSGSPSVIPSLSPSTDPSPVPSLVPSTQPSTLPSSSPSLTLPSQLPSSDPSQAPTLQPSVGSQAPSTAPSALPSGSQAPSTTPSALPSGSIAPSTAPSALPSGSEAPSTTPSSLPSGSEAPSTAPSTLPSGLPSSSSQPSSDPSSNPTNSQVPSNQPSSNPSTFPSFIPSTQPSATPSSAPSAPPTLSAQPSGVPSFGPTNSQVPSFYPSLGPSKSPSVSPSRGPSTSPSTGPSTGPSIAPSTAPSKGPSTGPSTGPSLAPSTGPSIAPSTAPSTGPSTEPSIAPSTGSSTGPSTRPSTAPSVAFSTTPASIFPSLVSSVTFIPSSSGTVTVNPSSLGTFIPSFFHSHTIIPSFSHSHTIIPSFSSTGSGTGSGSVRRGLLFDEYETELPTSTPSSADTSASFVPSVSGVPSLWSDAPSVIPFMAQSESGNLPEATPIISSRAVLKTAINDWVDNGESIYGPIGSWDVARVTDFSGLFQKKIGFDDDISAWTTKQVTDMAFMFEGACLFNQDLSSWDVSRVSSFLGMFQNAGSFNQDLCTGWSTKITATKQELQDMFDSAKSCPTQADPTRQRGYVSPLCYVCQSPFLPKTPGIT